MLDLAGLVELFFDPSAEGQEPTVVAIHDLTRTEDEPLFQRLSGEGCVFQFADATRLRELAWKGWQPVTEFDSDGRLTGMDVGDAGAMGGALRALLGEGEPLERVLPAFTSNVARLLRLSSKGIIAPGADADLVVLGADGSVEDVMARGRWHVTDGVPLVLGPFERELQTDL